MNVHIDSVVLKRGAVNNITLSVLISVIKYFFPQNEKNILFYDFIIGFWLIYIMDILLVQKKFNLKNKITNVAYNDYFTRVKYLFKPSIFYKYLIVIGIGTIITRSVFKYVNNLLKKYNILQEKKIQYYRDSLLIIVIQFFISLMLLNYLKYNWAYIDSDDIQLSIIILSLFSLSILISTS